MFQQILRFITYLSIQIDFVSRCIMPEVRQEKQTFRKLCVYTRRKIRKDFPLKNSVSVLKIKITQETFPWEKFKNSYPIVKWETFLMHHIHSL